ncbi:T-complex protein 1 subunit gamma [Culex quinquefasciatus]|uniref:T-complex protein 1 subunit gamma n=1 Tax=Culex quinquefasciatus TaxID=7176 RepID=B0XHD4_CULQU|nr:T-complex protein 1 subunit gamma [Culex quinquefasciatus]|eukprot:XP_001869056.1 T-complex protein 1 subunit gamma [Culex quinquefasciatus]
MLMDQMVRIVMTNDRNMILLEITSQHPVANSMIMIARTQDEEVVMEPPRRTVLIRAYRESLEDMIKLLQEGASVP